MTMEDNPFVNNPFAPKPPAPPESGFAEVIGSSPVAGMDPELEEAYSAAMADPEPLFAPIAPASVEDPLSAVVGRSRVQEPTDEQMQAYVDAVKKEKSEPVTAERKRARRFHADTPFVLGLLLFLVAAMAAASFYVSFYGVYSAAAWAVGDNPPLQFAVPFMLDVAIVAFTLALFVERERGERVWGTWVAIAIFAAVSATANILHTLVVSTATDNAQLLVGAVISGGAPVLLAFATDKIAVKVFKRADKN